MSKTNDDMDRLMDMLLVLREIDLALAPMVPSERMCQIGAEAGGITPELAKRIYTVMLLNAQNVSDAQGGLLH